MITLLAAGCGDWRDGEPPPEVTLQCETFWEADEACWFTHATDGLPRAMATITGAAVNAVTVNGEPAVRLTPDQASEVRPPGYFLEGDELTFVFPSNPSPAESAIFDVIVSYSGATTGSAQRRFRYTGVPPGGCRAHDPIATATTVTALATGCKEAVLSIASGSVASAYAYGSAADLLLAGPTQTNVHYELVARGYDGQLSRSRSDPYITPSSAMPTSNRYQFCATSGVDTLYDYWPANRTSSIYLYWPAVSVTAAQAEIESHYAGFTVNPGTC